MSGYVRVLDMDNEERSEAERLNSVIAEQAHRIAEVEQQLKAAKAAIMGGAEHELRRIQKNEV